MGHLNHETLIWLHEQGEREAGSLSCNGCCVCVCERERGGVACVSVVTLWVYFGDRKVERGVSQVEPL